MKHAKGLDPPFSHIGIGHDLRNWMPDTGASSHLTPRLLDLKEVEEGFNLGVKVADGHIVKCTARGIVEINMVADDGQPLKMSPDSDCISCRMSTIKAIARIKHQCTPVTKPGQAIYADTLPPIFAESHPKEPFSSPVDIGGCLF
jgi:hypothetical protein